MNFRHVRYLLCFVSLSLFSCESRDSSVISKSASTDPQELLRLLKKAESGDAESQFEFFQTFRKVAETEEEKALASKWCIAAGEQGHEEALGFVYSLYDSGEGVAVDKEKAFRWLLKAAEAEDNEILARWVADRYYHGSGTNSDIEKAIEWYERSARRLDRASIGRLGEIYWYGERVPRDVVAAMKYFREASGLSSRGSHPFAFYIAKAYFEGLGVEKDPALAYAWLKSTSSYGDKNRLEGMAMEGILEEILSSEEQATALLRTEKIKQEVVAENREKQRNLYMETQEP